MSIRKDAELRVKKKLRSFGCIMCLACLLKNKLELISIRQHEFCSINTSIVKI